ncbi:TPA: hypothetical protein G8R56_004038 [Salmonella enterica]|uniref:Secreted protein n=1 Tax=Salmonella enterica TaxID=28901 RepID=A0A5U3IFM3_SALER|nr:hypothetical protein [Salmonella enterica]EBS3740234.1 hypothetical protein [Salmonella enterica subsp. enterica serovar Saintpaul]EEH4118595.1 hypothetical protein [Salmonella enterica subsp. enterica serovar Hvittingfoss]EBX0752659.1 hypothetical protein [Salmonella enterica subsp. enterica serovar Saintpaul]ECB0579444.1 hypothetical protein [Salmonella enterica subsp. enterica serovar Saintpaul]
MKKIILILSLMLLSFSSFSAETRSSRNDEECRFVASQIGGICENGWAYAIKKDELRDTQDYRALLLNEKSSRLNRNDIAVLVVHSEDNKKMRGASLDLNNDTFVCEAKKVCSGLIRINDGEIFVFYYFTLPDDNHIAYFKANPFKKAQKIVIEIPTKENKKRQFVFYAGDIKWSN